jgi:hypothetical protein
LEAPALGNQRQTRRKKSGGVNQAILLGEAKFLLAQQKAGTAASASRVGWNKSPNSDAL